MCYMNSKKDQNNSEFSRVYIWFFPIWWSSVPSLHWTPDTKCLALILYRHTSLYLSLLPFYTLKVCDGLLSSNFYQYYLSTAFVHLICLCCTLVILSIILNFSFWVYLLWWLVISDLRCYHCKIIMIHWKLRQTAIIFWHRIL